MYRNNFVPEDDGSAAVSYTLFCKRPDLHHSICPGSFAHLSCGDMLIESRAGGMEPGGTLNVRPASVFKFMYGRDFGTPELE